MSSPIPIPTPKDASPSSPALYVPVHRRSPSSSSSRTSSPSPSSSPALSPSPSSTHPTLLIPTPTPASALRRGIYTTAELLLLSTSPLAKLSAGDVDVLRALAPEVVQTRKQRKAVAWHVRHPTPTDAPRSHKRTSSRGSHAHTSESEEERATTWRRV